jgi:hypothetical protein
MNNKGVVVFVVILIAGFIGVLGNLYLESIDAPAKVELTRPDPQKG